MQEQAAQISGNKNKSHLPDDFVHVKNFKNLDSMHANNRSCSPNNRPSGRKAELIDQVGDKNEYRGIEDATSVQFGSEDSEFWPEESQSAQEDSKNTAEEGQAGQNGAKLRKKKQ